jgi:DNA-binding NarL/FixJ family response regulator
MLQSRILIVDDHLAVRNTLRTLLDWHSFQVCGDAKDGKEAIEKVVELKPDVVLMDINMPVMNGIAAATEIRRLAPGTKIIFLTMHDGPGFRVGTKQWAHGFVPKAEAGTELIATLRQVCGLTASEVKVECPKCKVRQKVYIAKEGSGPERAGSHKERQYLSCTNCGSEFDVKARNIILSGPFPV